MTGDVSPGSGNMNGDFWPVGQTPPNTRRYVSSLSLIYLVSPVPPAI